MSRRILLAAAVAALTGLAASPAQATFPGHNGRIAVDRMVGKQSDLFTINPDGTDDTRLTKTAWWENKAEWSADGQRLAYGLGSPSGSESDIWTIAADGTDARRLTRFHKLSDAPSWSPDGALAYFTTRDYQQPGPHDPPPPAEIYSMAGDGSGQHRLTHDGQIETDAEWAPDGATIAWSQWCAVKGQPGVFDIGVAVAHPDGSGRHMVLPCLARRDIISFNWSPDGSRFVLEITAPGPKKGSRQSDLAVVNADGTGMHRLTKTAGAGESNPVFSPDGRLIAFTSDRAAPGGDRNGSAFELYVMQADGSGIRRLTHNHVPDSHPDWQPLP